MNIDEVLALLEPDKIITKWRGNENLFTEVSLITERAKDFNTPYPQEVYEKDLEFFKSHPEIKRKYITALKCAYKYRRFRI